MNNDELLLRTKEVFWERALKHRGVPYDLCVPKYRTGDPLVPKPQVAMEVNYHRRADRALKEAFHDEAALDRLKRSLEFQLSPTGEDRFVLIISIS